MGLRRLLIQKIISSRKTDCEIYEIYSDTSSEVLFSQPLRQSKNKLVVVYEPDRLDWIEQWYKTTPFRLVVDIANKSVATDLELSLKTRIQLIECVPTNKPAFVKSLANMVGVSQYKLSKLIEACEGNVSEALEVVHKSRVLGIEPNPNLVIPLAPSSVVEDIFISALISGDKTKALSVLSLLSFNRYGDIVSKLESTVLLLARINESKTPLKKNYEIAAELGVSVAEVSLWSHCSKTYDTAKTKKCSLLLANADRDLERSRGLGLLEMLVSAW